MIRRWPIWILRHGGLVSAAAVLLTAAAALQAREVRFDFNFQEYFPDDDPVRDAYRGMIADFPGEASEVVVVVRDSSLFTPERIAALRTLTAEMDAAPWSTTVVSPFSLPDEIFGADRRLYGPVLAGSDARPDAYVMLRKEMSEHPLLQDQLIFDGGRTAAIRVTLTADHANDVGREQVRESLRAQLPIYASTFDILFYTGASGIRADFAQVLRKEQRRLFPLVLILLVGVLYLTLGRSWLLALPIVTSLIAIVWTMAFMALGGAPFTVLSSATPLLILIIGISDSMHVFFHLRTELASDLGRTRAVVSTFQYLGAACLLTSVTTAIGFFALVLTNLSVLRSFGLYTGLGVLLNYVVMMGLLPILLHRLPVRHLQFQAVGMIRALRLTVITGVLSSLTRRKPSLIAAAAVTLFAAAGCFFLYEETSVYQGLKSGTVLYEKIRLSEAYIGGLLPFGVMLQAREDAPLLSQENIRRMEIVQTYLNGRTGVVGSTFSPVDLQDWLQQMQGLGSSVSFQQALPVLQTRAPALLAIVVNQDARRLLIRCRLRDVGSRTFRVFVANLEPVLARAGGSWTIAGLPNLSLRLSEKVVTYIITTIGLTMGLIFVGFVVWFRSFRYAAVAIIPNLIPLFCILGLLGWVGISLQPSVVIVFSVVFGIAVNDTIHFLSRFAWVRRQNPDRAVEITLERTAEPMISSSVVLVVGFSILLLSDFLGLMYLGLLVGVGIAAALFSDLFVLPLLLKRR